MVLRNIAKERFYKRFSKLGLEARWKKQHSKVRISKVISKEKTSISAYLCGDGWIKARKENYNKKAVHYDIKIALDNLQLSKEVVSLFSKEYNIKPKIKQRGGYYEISIKNKPACLDLLKLGKYNSLEWEIPKGLSLNLKKYWIRCFFDCEAYVSSHSKNIQVKSINGKGLSSSKKELELFKINSKLYGPYKQKSSNINNNHSDYYVLVISKKNGNLTKYESLISFNHPNKKYRLKKLLQ